MTSKQQNRGNVNRGYLAALAYVQGHTNDHPTEEQLDETRADLRATVERIDVLIAESARLREENARLTSEVAHQTAPVNLEVIAETQDKILGKSTPCGQIMRIAQSNGQDIFAICINAGMAINGGKCLIHAPKKARTQSYVSVARASK
jgi:regulator of replication initiation timing